MRKRSKLLCLLALIIALTFGSTLSVSAATKTVKVEKRQGSYYATMSLVRNTSKGTISNGKYVNSGKKEHFLRSRFLESYKSYNHLANS